LVGTINESLKFDLALELLKIIKSEKLDLKALADILKLNIRKTTNLCVGKLKGFTLSNLFQFVNMLGYDVIIKIRKANVVRKEEYTATSKLRKE